jgi:hypothetical protein
MKNILFATAASIGLSASAQTQTPQTLFQYEQEIITVLKKAIKQGIAEPNALPMVEWENCYEFAVEVNGLDRQVYYCTDKDKWFVSRWEKPKDVDPKTEAKPVLDAIIKKYPSK